MPRTKVSEDDFIDPTYKTWISSKGANRKLIRILRVIVKQPSTFEQLHTETRIAVSDLHKLVEIAEKKKYIKRQIPSKQSKPRGRPICSKHQEHMGKKKHKFVITGNGRWLMRLDPELRDKWEEIQRNYPIDVARTVFDSYANLKCGIKKSQKLRHFEAFDQNYQLLDNYLEMLALRPFLFTNKNQETEAVDCYDELVDVIANYVLPEHKVDYYLALENSLNKLNREIEMHKILLDKIKRITEIKEHIAQQQDKKFLT
ncbi:MAG: hypothetical protein NWE93_06660 [Candidatus Bathyarchaeota archaeon]|nr:hypothetical protein [Candidatus Bathyarchaeota archaeon]